MTSNIDAVLISIWQKSVAADGKERPTTEKNIVLDICNAFQQHADRIWQCDIEELDLINRKFGQLKPSKSIRSVQEQIEQTIDIYNIAKKDVSQTITIINTRNIRDQNLLFALAKICAEQNGWIVTKNIKRFNITDQSRLFEIAKICAEQNGWVTAENITNFKISDQNNRVKIAKICAQKYGWGTALNIQRFNITDRDKLFKIAKICAETQGGGTAENVNNFNITDPDKLFEIAKICAENDGGKTARYIRQFNITDPDKLFEIAKICAEQNSADVALHIRNFNITGQRLQEIAKICARQDGGGTADNINNFNITDPDQLFEIAKICAADNGWTTANNLKSFNITDPERIFEIAKICAENDGWGTTYHIKKFNITDPERIFEIAKICARNNGRGTAQEVKNFNITDQNKLFEIAKICAMQNGAGVPEYIQNFNITDQNKLFEIAKICAMQNGEKTAQNIQNFQIEDENKRKHILLITILQNPRNIKYWKDDAAGNLPAIYDEPFNPETAEEIINSYIAKRLPVQGFEQLVTRLKKHPRMVQKDLLRNLGPLLFLLTEWCDEDKVRRVKELQIIEALQDFKNPYLRWDLTKTLITVASGPVITNITPSHKTSPEARLIRLLKACLIQRGVAEKEALQLEKNIIKYRDLLKNAKKSHVVIETLLRLTKEHVFNANQINDIIIRLTQEREEMAIKKRGDALLKELRSINNLILMGKSSYLTQSGYTFSAALEEGLRSIIPLKKIDNFADRYFETFESSRDPTAIITYAAKISSLHDQLVTDALGRFVTNVLKGTFNTDRYGVEDNIHLQTIKERAPRILEKWQELLGPLSFNKITGTETQKFSPEEWLHSKLIQDKYLQLFENRLPSLFGYLKRDDKTEGVDQYLKETVNKKSRERDKERQTLLNVEQLCLKLLQTKDETAIIGLLKNLKRKLEDPLFNKTNFLDNLDEIIIKLEKTKKESSGDLVVLETRDYMDILLCGTEIMGSCQRLNGDPNLNKGLLGYLLDGKNHILAIKAEQGPKGRLLARCLLKLLWDGERPVLFREKFYPEGMFRKYETALNTLAIRKAKNLEIPLLSLDGNGQNYKKKLYSLGGPAPFEYSDGSHGLMQNGKYSVSGVKFLIDDRS